MVEHTWQNVVNSTQGRAQGAFVMSDAGIRWKPTPETAAESFEVEREEVSKLMWTTCGNLGMLHVFVTPKEGGEKSRYERFDGFARDDQEKFQAMVDEFYKDCPFEEEKLASSGTNAGTLSIDKDRGALVLSSAGRRAIELQLKTIKLCVATGKSDVEVQFADDDAGLRSDESLVEIKFHIPSDADGTDLSEVWAKRLVAAAEIKRNTGDMIVELPEEVVFQAPRGRFVIQMFDKSFMMVGKTYTFRIAYKSVSRMFLLSRPDQTASTLVISLDDPIQQGQQRHKHLVLLLDQKDTEIEINLSREDLRAKFQDAFENPIIGALPETVARLFKILSNKKVYVPGSFSSYDDAKAIKCSLKSTNAGLLYPLTKSFLFIHKPATFIRYEDVEYVEFARQGGSMSSRFDLVVKVRPVAGDVEHTYTFSLIDNEEYKPLFNFLKGRKLRIKDERAAEAEIDAALDIQEDPRGAVAQTMEEESDDEDFESGDEKHSSDSDDSDVSLASDDFAADAVRTAHRKAAKSGDKPKKERGAEGGGDDNSEDDDDDDDDDDDEEEDGSKPAKEKKRKGPPKRDPSAPKPAKSANQFFQAERREALKDENIEFGEMAKRLGAEWKALDEAGREKYAKLHEQDVERYKKEMEGYKPAEGYGDDGVLNSSRKTKVAVKKEAKETKKPKRDPNAPKPAKSANQFFQAERREALKDENIEFVEMSKRLGAEWKALDEAGRKKYAKLNEKDVERYNKELEAYEAPEGYDDKGVLLKVGADASPASKRKREVAAAKPKGKAAKVASDAKKAKAPTKKDKPAPAKKGKSSKDVQEKDKDDDDEEEEDGSSSASESGSGSSGSGSGSESSGSGSGSGSDEEEEEEEKPKKKKPKAK